MHPPCRECSGYNTSRSSMLAETEAKLATAAPAKKASSMAYTEADNPSTRLIAPPMRAATEQRIQLFRLAHGNKAIEWHRRDKNGASRRATRTKP